MKSQIWIFKILLYHHCGVDAFFSVKWIRDYFFYLTYAVTLIHFNRVICCRQ